MAEVNVAMDNCGDTDSVKGITNQFLQQARSVFQKQTEDRYNGKHKFCSGNKCENLQTSPDPTCEVIAGRKRAITHRLFIQIIFKDIK